MLTRMLALLWMVLIGLAGAAPGHADEALYPAWTGPVLMALYGADADRISLVDAGGGMARIASWPASLGAQPTPEALRAAAAQPLRDYQLHEAETAADERLSGAYQGVWSLTECRRFATWQQGIREEALLPGQVPEVRLVCAAHETALSAFRAELTVLTDPDEIWAWRPGQPGQYQWPGLPE